MVSTDRRIKRIGSKVLNGNPDFADLLEVGARIAFLSSDVQKVQNRKTVFADCRKVDKQYAWCCKYDFMITVYLPNVEGFTAEQMEILMEHELRHCGVDFDGEEPSFYIVPHDVEEFYPIIRQYGMDWQGGSGNAKREQPEQ